jgi:protein TonB
MVVASVDSSGRVRSVSLARGSGYAVLDQAALQSVRTWKFKPKKIGGQPTDSSVEVPVNFSLRR